MNGVQNYFFFNLNDELDIDLCEGKYINFGKTIIFDEDAAFIVMRFSQNDENDNAYKYGIKEALEKLNIKAVRADNSISSGQLLEKIQRNIEKSRYVIAKVDSDNLNVYFELGLAMGLDKDVLLISEKELVLQLPSDLRNAGMYYLR